MFVSLKLTSRGLSLPFRECRPWASTHLPSLPPAFFNRDDAGQHLQTPCPFALTPCNDPAAGTGGLRIEAFGTAASTALIRLVPALRRDFLRRYPRGRCTNPFIDSADIFTQGRRHDYAVEDFVVQNHRARRALFRDTRSEEELTKLALPLFRQSLEQRAALADLEVPEDAFFFGFKAEQHFPAYAGDTPKTTVRLTFASNLVFRGPWYLGPLASKGCGRLHAVRQPQEAQLPEAALA